MRFPANNHLVWGTVNLVVKLVSAAPQLLPHCLFDIVGVAPIYSRKCEQLVHARAASLVFRGAFREASQLLLALRVDTLRLSRRGHPDDVERLVERIRVVHAAPVDNNRVEIQLQKFHLSALGDIQINADLLVEVMWKTVEIDG